MIRILRRLLLLLVALVSSHVGYHLVLELGGAEPGTLGSAAVRSADAALGTGYHLSDLKLFDRTRYYVLEKYVEPDRIDPELMFEEALDAVEREVDEVLVQREPGGRLLHLSVGAYNTTLTVESLDTMTAMAREIQDVAAILEERLDLEPESMREVEYALINGMLSTLDPHTVLMPPDISREMDVENQGEFGGLGITITVRDGRLTVEYPLEDTPAYRAGIKAGDHIIRIEDESTINMSLPEAVSKLRGPPGEPVRIMVMRERFDQPKPFEIVRDIIRINPVEGELLEGGIGYLRIKNFHANTSRDLDSALAGFRRELGQEPEGVILDLRGNPGGFLSQAVEVADRFLRTGVVVSTVTSNGRREVEQASAARTEPDYPMAVLTSADSASASEIVAGALKRQGRAVVVGERTFGKGSVQHLYGNADDSKLKITVAQYLTPGDRSIQSVGISPDIHLVPQVVQRMEPDPDEEEGEEGADAGPAEPMVSLLWREGVRREADLDHHLVWNDGMVDEPSYRIPYLFDVDQEEEQRRYGRRNPANDWEVQFAREVLLTAEGSSRADVVASAGEVVERRRAEQAERIRQAFADLGIPWTPGDQPASPELALDVQLGEDGILDAGEEERIRLTLTNNGDQPVHQVFAVSSSDNDAFDRNEFYFGDLDPGESRDYVRTVELPDGYPDEVDGVRFELRDPHRSVLGERQIFFETRSRPMPQYAYSLRFLEDGSGGSEGDGDGLLEVGEVVDAEITVTDIGKGPGGQTYAKLVNEAGRDIDLRVGNLDLGSPAPGEEVSGRFTFEVRGVGGDDDPLLEVEVGDNARYDYAGVVRLGFYDYLGLQESLRIPVHTEEQPVSAAELEPFSRRRQGPAVEVTRRPELKVSSPRVVISGMVRDDIGVRDVMVYHDEEKVFYQGGGGDSPALPFSVERELTPGLNTFAILGHDSDGLAVIRSLSVWYADGTVETSGQAARTGAM